MVLGFRIFFPLLLTRHISPFSIDSFRLSSKQLEVKIRFVSKVLYNSVRAKHQFEIIILKRVVG